MIIKKSFLPILRTGLASCSVLLFSSILSATPITGGMTTVALDSGTLATLQSLFTIGTVPPTMLTMPEGVATVDFPITGGDTSTGMIQHSGGLSLTAVSTPSGVGTEVVTQNYLIDLNTNKLSAEVIVNGGTPLMNVPLFDIGAGDALTVDATLGSELVTLFGVPNLTGAAIGTATVSPSTSSTPEPASFALVGAGLLAAFSLIRSKHARS